MGTITTKYIAGDRVWREANETVSVWIACPDCKGEKTWMVTFADGHQEELPCQTCNSHWEGSLGRIETHEYRPAIRSLTIGQVNIYDGELHYMCEETGIGSGTLHSESCLHNNEESAWADAKARYEKQQAHIASMNYRKKGSFAGRATSTLGFSRQQALLAEREMRKWLELVGSKSLKPTEIPTDEQA